MRIAPLIVLTLIATSACEPKETLVTLSGPPDLVGAKVMVRGTSIETRMGRERPDGLIETNEPLRVRGNGSDLLVSQKGCAPLVVPIVPSARAQLVRIEQSQLKCHGVVGGIIDYPLPGRRETKSR